ncbi:MAG: oligosaccharide flippase family protein, partial [Bacteroidetes bacterium]|nr:oligosaccharide flippase family protein [Bacteroidota bacterium]
MKNLIDFLKNFLKNEGHFVFVSLMIAKICAFLGSILIIKLLPVSEFGVISIVGSVFAIFAPFNGFGNPQSLLRFGAVLSDNNSKVELANFLFRKGFFSQIILSILFLLCSVFYYQKYQDVVLVFVFFAIRLMGVFFQAHIQSELRINDKNRIFAKMNNIQNISTLLLMLVLCYYFGLMGYLVAVCISPFISLYWMDGFRLKNNSFNLNISVQEIRNYALHSAGTASFSDALFSLDIIILGYLLTENDVANYKVALLIPANITFLALSFMQTDFPTIAKNATNKTFLKNYIINYYKLFIPICIAIVGIGSVWRKEIFSLLFKEQYM